jgi:hypothetical protein
VNGGIPTSDYLIPYVLSLAPASCYNEVNEKTGDDSVKAKPLLPVKSDFVFKLIFGDQRNVDILAEFLMSILDIPKEEYDKLTIVDPHIKKESKDEKYGIVDVKTNSIKNIKTNNFHSGAFHAALGME